MTVNKSTEAALIRRKAIWESMGETLYPTKRPLITLEQFFLHSAGEADLWYNIYPYPEDIDQYDFHCSIRARLEVWDVLISITQMDEEPIHAAPESVEKYHVEWPNSDHTLIVTRADEATIRSWFPSEVQPSEVTIGDWSDTAWGAPSFIPRGFHQAWLWYD